MSTFDDDFFADDDDRNAFDDDGVPTSVATVVVIGSVLPGLCCCGYVALAIYWFVYRARQNRSNTSAIGQATVHRSTNGPVPVQMYHGPGAVASHQQLFGQGGGQQTPLGQPTPPAPYAQGPQQPSMGQFEQVAYALSSADQDHVVIKLLSQLRDVVGNPSISKPGDARNRLHANQLAGVQTNPSAWSALNESEFQEILTMLPPDSFRPPGQPDYEAIAAQRAQANAYGQPSPPAMHIHAPSGSFGQPSPYTAQSTYGPPTGGGGGQNGVVPGASVGHTSSGGSGGINPPPYPGASTGFYGQPPAASQAPVNPGWGGGGGAVPPPTSSSGRGQGSPYPQGGGFV